MRDETRSPPARVHLCEDDVAERKRAPPRLCSLHHPLHKEHEDDRVACQTILYAPKAHAVPREAGSPPTDSRMAHRGTARPLHIITDLLAMGVPFRKTGCALGSCFRQKADVMGNETRSPPATTARGSACSSVLSSCFRQKADVMRGVTRSPPASTARGSAYSSVLGSCFRQKADVMGNETRSPPASTVPGSGPEDGLTPRSHYRCASSATLCSSRRRSGRPPYRF